MYQCCQMVYPFGLEYVLCRCFSDGRIFWVVLSVRIRGSACAVDTGISAVGNYSGMSGIGSLYVFTGRVRIYSAMGSGREEGSEKRQV